MIGYTDLDPTQREALDRATRFVRGRVLPVFTIAGYAGSGKSTVAALLIERFPKALIIAPTASAANALSNKIADNDVMTIHMAIKLFKSERKGEDGRTRIEWTDKKKRPHWSLVILDESSMVSIALMADILRHCDQVVAFGDPGQLPPVADGGSRPENSLPAFVEAGAMAGQFAPDIVLDKNHRQGPGSGIIRQANRVRRTGMCEDDGPEFRRITAECYEDVEWDLGGADKVLCPTHAIRGPLVQFLREQAGFSGPAIQPGERLTCRDNNYRLGLFNGGQYLVRAPREPGEPLHITDDAAEQYVVKDALVEGPERSAGDQKQRGKTRFDLGYAATAHSAQGSEWDHVVIVGDWPGRQDRWRWMYTAITRARCSVILLTIETAAEAESNRLIFDEGVL